MPEYDLSNETVRVEIIGKVIDEEFATLLTQNKNLSLFDIMMLDKVQKHKPLNDEEIEKLRKNHFIEGRKPNFYLSYNVVNPIDDRKLKAEYIKNKSFDDDHFRSMIIRYIKQYKKATKKEILELLTEKLSDVLTEEQKNSKIKNLLTSLRQSGKIESKNGHWFLTGK